MVHYRVCFCSSGFPIGGSWREWCATLEEAIAEKELAIVRAKENGDNNPDVIIIKVTEEIL